MPSAIDLFAGAGGLSLGLQAAGWQVLGVEWNEAACATHNANVGPCIVADTGTWRPERRVDLVAGGPPCQPFTNQGLKLGLRDPRSRRVLVGNAVPPLEAAHLGTALRRVLG